MGFYLSKESPVPLHTQLLNELRRAILAGELQPHTRVPSEPELAHALSISRTTIRQAWHAAEDEGLLYRVHGKGTYVAESAGTQPAKLIGFLIPNFRSTFDSQLLSGAERYLRERGYRVMFAHTDRAVDEENRLMREMSREGVSGFLLWPAMGEGQRRYLEANHAIPAVFLDRSIPGVDYPCVAAEHYQGGCYAVQHLIDLGHSAIGFVSRPHLTLWPIAERLRAYNDTLHAAGLLPHPPILVGDSAELGVRYAEESYADARGQEISQLQVILSQPDRPTALFAMNDLMALQVLRAANLAGLKVPDDLSLVGFDDMEIVSHIDPPLTTVAQNPFRVGAEAARVLLDLVGGKRPDQPTILLPTRLIVRESTARLPKGIPEAR
ncbi:MAG: GntR family transcriptional regulator [Anaerolineae bacterium]|nr:GntR family transcriptional regulator [Anaerolineae bacterium]